MDETQTIRDLVAIMDEHGLDQVKVKVGDAVYELVRRDPAAYVDVAPAGIGTPAAIAAAAGAAPANVQRVTAPLTGVFYSSASPDSEPFVTVGQHVDAGDVICILEAMKLFNEIQSDYGGTVTRIVAESGELVSQGDDLFWIEP